MFQAIRRRIHVSPATAIATLALVFAMTGGAYAAKHYLITSTKQISPKVLKALKGNAGPAGAAGLAGAAGAAGAQGPAGPAGAGKDGAPGTPGAPGAPGTNGKDGSPWTVGGTLPSGKTLKGVWSVTEHVSAGGISAGLVYSSVSFGIPLAEAPAPGYVRAPTEAEEEKHEFPPPAAGCTGNVENPGAEKGHLCVFARVEANTEPGSVGHELPKICSPGKESVINCFFSVASRAEPFGFGVVTAAKEAGLVQIEGTWAVTAE